MKPTRHIIASSFAGITIWVLGKNLFAGLICFSCGVLPDADHILEFIIHYGIKNFSIEKVYKAFSKSKENTQIPKFKKLYLFFHSNELAIILWLGLLFRSNIYILAAAVGYTLHLLMDTRGNVQSKEFYFFTYRMQKKFDTKVLFEMEKN